MIGRKQHHIICVPGLRDQAAFNRAAQKVVPVFWKRYGFYGHIVAPHWEEGKAFGPKLQIILDTTEKLLKQGHLVSYVGVSAGGSAVLNAFTETKDVVVGVVDATGRLRAGKNVKPTLAHAARISPAFKESVLFFEQTNEQRLTAKDRKRVMTIRPAWDETVPASTVPLAGATNLVAPIVEHSLGGAFICTFYAGKMLWFLRKLEKYHQYA